MALLITNLSGGLLMKKSNAFTFSPLSAPFQPQTRDAARDVHACTLDQNPAISSYPVALGEYLRPFPLWRILKREIGSFLCRMRAILKTQIYRRGIGYGPPSQPGMTSQERRQYQDICTEDMQHLFDERPWLTSVDGEIFLRGWMQGFASHPYIRDTADTLPIREA